MSRECLTENGGVENFYYGLKRLVILREVEEIRGKDRKEYGNDVDGDFLNNWFSNIYPYGFRTYDPSDKRYSSEYRSLLRNTKTEREFITEVNKVVEECGLDFEKIGKLQKYGPYQKINEYTLPAYIELRLRGYNHYDLIG